MKKLGENNKILNVFSTLDKCIFIANYNLANPKEKGHNKVTVYLLKVHTILE